MMTDLTKSTTRLGDLVIAAAETSERLKMIEEEKERLTGSVRNMRKGLEEAVMSRVKEAGKTATGVVLELAKGCLALTQR